MDWKLPGDNRKTDNRNIIFLIVKDSQNIIELVNIPGKSVFRCLARLVRGRLANFVDPSTSFISASLLRSKEAMIFLLEATNPCDPRAMQDPSSFSVTRKLFLV